MELPEEEGQCEVANSSVGVAHSTVGPRSDPLHPYEQALFLSGRRSSSQI